MLPRDRMIMIGLLASALGCPGGELPPPSDVGLQGQGLQWEQIDQEVLLTPRSPEALYLVVRSDTSTEDAQISFERGAIRIGEGVVYELKPEPLLKCSPGSQCQECKPDARDQPDCVWPPPPPAPGGFLVWEMPPPARDVQLQR